MQLTFLVDNNTLIDRYLLGEPGLSILVEDRETRVLFDAGYSDTFLINAGRMGLDLLDLDWVALSHGHIDHTWGLDCLIRHYVERVQTGASLPRPKLLAHPDAFDTKQSRRLPEIGSLMDATKLSRHFDMNLTREPVWLTDRLVSLGEIERTFDFERSDPMGKRLTNTGTVGDDLPDDTALAYVSDDGLTVISGCSHSGICNIVEQARRVTGVERVHTVLGGFHLLDAPKERLDKTAEYLGALDLHGLYACHCTDLAAKIALARTCPVKEVGSGLSLTF